MAYISLTLIVVSTTVVASLYFGIWGSLLDAFTDQKLRDDLLIATRLSEYENARTAAPANESMSALSFFKQAEMLSVRQREVFKDILDSTNKKLLSKLMLLVLLIGWGSIYLSHKIAGPLYRMHWALGELDRGNYAVRIRLRQGDEAQFMASRFNQTIENLDFLFGRLKNIVRENEANPGRLHARLKEELSKIKTSGES